MFNIIFWIVVLLNYGAINYCVFTGTISGNISFLFQERQAITFLSALQLGLTSILAIGTYVIGRILYKKDAAYLKEIRIWSISAVLFAFAVLDEYFMIHEGIDGGVFNIFLGVTDNPHLDGVTLAAYLIAALCVFLKFKKEILKHKDAFNLFCAGGFFFLASIMLDIKSVDNFRVILEESAKLMAVAFLFLGHISVFSDYVEMLDARLNKK